MIISHETALNMMFTGSFVDLRFQACDHGSLDYLQVVKHLHVCLASLTWKRGWGRSLSLLSREVSLPAQPTDRIVAGRPAEVLGDFVRCYISSAALFKDILICLRWVLVANLQFSSD